MPIELTLDDVSRVVRLTREVLERWDDPAKWRECLLQGACGLLHGHIGTMFVQDDPQPVGFGRLAVLAVVPTQLYETVGPALAAFSGRTYEDVSAQSLPGVSNLWDEFCRQGGSVTTCRNELTDEASDHAGRHYLDFRRRIDADDYMVSVRLVDVPRRAEGLVVDRPHGAPRFGPREVTLLKLLHDEVAPLIGVRLATEEHLSRDGLSSRLRETLALLLDGLGEKQIARRLRLSPSTVHEYVGMLYKHFEVSSRAELLAYFVRRTPLPRSGTNP